MTGTSPDWEALTTQAESLLHRLFPICRSITGKGTRDSLALLREFTDFQVNEIASGTRCYDWTVPDEWNVHDAYVADSKGRRVIDFQANNLHLVNYSIPFEGRLSFDELSSHLYTLPKLTKAIPYRTTYYHRDWGFCLSYEDFQKLDHSENYHVLVDTTLEPGSLTYGEALLPGRSRREFLISTYVCHPSLANDNLSGVVLWSLLLSELKKQSLRHSYRFVIAPETIGSIAYISQNEASVKALAGGFVLTTVGGPGSFGYKTTWEGDSLIDRVVRQTFKESNLEYIEYPFDISGSDERQYSTPGLRVPVGTICKDKYYEYDYYHTSLDDLEFVRADALVESLKIYLRVIRSLEVDRTYISKNPTCEPMFGKRGLYPQLGGGIHQKAAGVNNSAAELDALRWIMFYADGKTSLLSIARKTDLPMTLLAQAAEKLVAGGLLEEVP